MGEMMDIDRRGGGRSSPSGIWSWHDLLYGRCGAIYPLPGAGAGLPRRETYEEGETFEEAYPRYPFSELVRLSVALGNAIARRLGRRPADTPKALPEPKPRPTARTKDRRPCEVVG